MVKRVRRSVSVSEPAMRTFEELSVKFSTTAQTVLQLAVEYVALKQYIPILDEEKKVKTFDDFLIKFTKFNKKEISNGNKN